MKIRNNLKGTKGFASAYNRLVRYRYMVTDTAKKRLKILSHYEKFGLASTLNAFEVKKRTLQYWKQRFESGGRRPEALNPQSRTPQRKRTQGMEHSHYRRNQKIEECPP